MCISIFVLCALAMLATCRQIFRVSIMRSLAAENNVLGEFTWLRYMIVPSALGVSVAFMGGVLEEPFGTRGSLIVLLVFQLIQLSVWLFDLQLEVREPLRYASTTERSIITRLHAASVIVHTSSGCFMLDLFLRRIFVVNHLKAEIEDYCLFAVSVMLWTVFVVTHARLHELSWLFESVWPGGRASLTNQTVDSKEGDDSLKLCDTSDASSIVLRDNSDQRIYTIRLDNDFDAYAYLHKKSTPNGAPSAMDAEGMHIARVGAGPRIFDPTFTDNEDSTRSVIGRVTLWRLVWGVHFWCIALYLASLFYLCAKVTRMTS
jgi:hypothetical protein